MPSPVPKHLRTEEEYSSVPKSLKDHICDLQIDKSRAIKVAGATRHRAKFAPGLASVLCDIANSKSLGDPMAGTGTLAHETGLAVGLNDIDINMAQYLDPLAEKGCVVSYKPAHLIEWEREVLIFSPPYYPRTDRRMPNAHDDVKRGPIVGFRDSYDCNHPLFIGNPGGANAILTYREQMRTVYAHLRKISNKLIIVTKNWTRLGVELRLDLDTILMCQETGWRCVARHGFKPDPSLWSQFNAARGGGVQIEDILIFERV